MIGETRLSVEPRMKSGKDLQAVLFDFDGVLADTENVHIAAWERTFQAIGLDVPPDICLRAAEEDDRAFLANVLVSRKIPGGDIHGWVARKQQLTRMILADSPRLYAGVRPLAAGLRARGLILGVVTGTWRENVAIVVGTSGLSDSFTLVVGKEDVARTKPDPEAYVVALERLGIRSDQAIALEDSPSGIAAAREAGVHAIAVGHRHAQGDWTARAPYLADFRDLGAALAAITGRAKRPVTRGR
jgi:HAD superfamily hydrolase (TIGR01509 family)